MAFTERAYFVNRFSGAFLTGISVIGLSTSLHAQADSVNATHTSGTLDFVIFAGPLENALLQFGRQADVRIAYQSKIASGKTSRGVSGRYLPQVALAQILAGSGLNYRFTSANTVTISSGLATVDQVGAAGTTLLDTITVTSGNGIAPGEASYRTATPTSYISGQTIERFRGSSPADIFRGTPGVMSGEARNGAGAIDVNIRGMQGMGRVATTIDGAENSISLYQGYQGISNRTFVDPDFLAGVDITKGSDAASSGIAGSVEMRTVNAEDIVKKGDRFGLKVKSGAGGNTSTPTAGVKSGYAITNPLQGTGSAIASENGMARPSFLEPTQGSVSVIGAMKEEYIDLLLGYAYRKQGNYHAGTHGPVANPENIGDRRFCYSSGRCTNFYYYDYQQNQGLANYRGGEEVLNTQLETKSYLAKGTLRFGDGHSVQLGYNGYRSEAGDQFASRLSSNASQATQQEDLVGTTLDTATFNYRWYPEENDLVDFKANLWMTKLESRNPLRNYDRVALSAPDGFRSGADSTMWGGGISNTSKFDTNYGDFDLTIGMSYKNEDTAPSAGSTYYDAGASSRDGQEQQAASYIKAAYKPVDWLTVNTGLRYQYFWSEDRSEPISNNSLTRQSFGQKLSSGGLSPSVGITIEPLEGMQFYANYSNSQRLPSLFETTTGFSTFFNDFLAPERASNWELGINIVSDEIFTASDRIMAKFSYFNWNIDNYIAREWKTDFVNTRGGNFSSMHVYNIDQAKFSGLEFSTQYEYKGFTAGLSANYYLNVEFCKTSATCEDKSLYADYATNQIPPEYSIDLTISQTFIDEKLTVGGRVSRIGSRTIGHGETTANGLQDFINQIEWKPYTLVDLFAEYKINELVTARFTVENLTDQFYIDPLSLVSQPGPGRTFYASLTMQF